MKWKVSVGLGGENWEGEVENSVEDVVKKLRNKVEAKEEKLKKGKE